MDDISGFDPITSLPIYAWILDVAWKQNKNDSDI